MKTTVEQRLSSPIASLLSDDQISPAQKAGIWTGIILTLCAVAVFIWLIVRASSIGDVRGIVMMSSFILFAVGLLYFLLARINNPKRAWVMLYITVPLAVAAFVLSLYLDGGNTERQEIALRAERTAMMQPATDGTTITPE